MRRGLVGSLLAAVPLALLVLLVLLVPAGPAGAVDVHGAPLPKGARSLEKDLFASSKSFRDTVEFYRKELARRSLLVEITPVERHRDVVYVRILPKDRAAGFRAIHVMLADGRTTIYIVAPEN